MAQRGPDSCLKIGIKNDSAVSNLGLCKGDGALNTILSQEKYHAREDEFCFGYKTCVFLLSIWLSMNQSNNTDDTALE